MWRLIIKPEFSHQTLIRPITRVTESVGRLMVAADKDTYTHFGIKRSVLGTVSPPVIRDSGS